MEEYIIYTVGIGVIAFVVTIISIIVLVLVKTVDFIERLAFKIYSTIRNLKTTIRK